MTERHHAVADRGSTAEVPSSVAVVTGSPVPGDPSEDQMIGTGEAAEIIGKDPRTVERWVDSGRIRGGRARDPITLEPIPGTWRWVDARQAVAIAVGAGRAHLIPEKWRHLIPLPHLPVSRSPGSS